MYKKRMTKRLGSAIAALYGDSTAVLHLKPATAPKKRNYDEDREQMSFNFWFEQFLWSKGYRWFHCPNGGRRNPSEGAKFKAMGVKRGVPDIMCPMGRSPYHGLAIELKRVDGSASDVSTEQREWLRFLEGQKWSTHVAFGFEQAKAIVLEYFA